MMKTVTATIDSIMPLTDRVTQLILTPEDYTEYQAGQYLQIIIGSEHLSYSIANAPLGSHKYELHIRHDPSNNAHQALFATIKRQGKVNVQLPLGNCHLCQLAPNKPILFIAGGTGFAPIKAMIEQLLADGDGRCFELYWGARSQSDLYMDDKVKQWETHVAHFRYFSLLSTDKTTNSLANLVESNHSTDLNNYQMVISGPFDMVYALRDHFVKAGISMSQLYSDAFSFE